MQPVNEPASPRANYQPPAAAMANRLHSGENINDAELSADLLQIKKLRKYIKENPIEDAFWRWPTEYRGLTDDEVYDKLASDPVWMQKITGSPTPLSPYSMATNFPGSLTHTNPTNYSSSPESQAGISQQNANARRAAIMEKEAENWQPSRWTPSGLVPDKRPYAVSKASRNRLGLPEFKKAAKWSSSTRSTLSDSELDELLAGKTEDERYFELARRGMEHEDIVELFTFGPPKGTSRKNYFRSLPALGGIRKGRKANRKTRKSNRRSRRSTRRN